MNKWPKKIQQLNEEEKKIRDQFVKLWHEVLPKKYELVENFNHRYPLKSKRSKKERILEIGAGIGSQLNYEKPDWREYVCLELRPEMAAVIQEKFPNATVLIGDCQEEIPFQDEYFDRILAIHVLEHLPNLPMALRQIRRVLKPEGLLSVCIPCEGGLAYRVARKISTQRLFKEYFPGWDYKRLVIANEHINLPQEIFAELSEQFVIMNTRYFPFLIPSIELNLIIGITLSPKK